MEDIANAIAATREAYHGIYRPSALAPAGDKPNGKVNGNVLGTHEAEG